MDSQKLALAGGKPVRAAMLPYGHQTIEDDDIRQVGEVLRGHWLTQGPTVAEFEKAFADYLGLRYAVAFANGTAALHGACFAAGLGPGDEAVVPAITFAATANAVIYLGAMPVLADVQPENGLMDPSQLSTLITKRTKVLLPVHYAGLPAEMDEVMKIARERGLLVIEDACHAPGATYRGRAAGTIGDMACFSFHPVKPITTGEGGMVVTNRAEFMNRLRLFRNHGIEKKPEWASQFGGWYYEMQQLGYNYRLTDIQAALGLSQLRKADRFLQARRRIAAFYDQAFSQTAGIAFLEEGPDRLCAYHLYPLLFEMDRLTCDKKTLFTALQAEGIGVQVHYIPIARHPFYREKNYEPSRTPQAEKFYLREISIPLYAGMTEADSRDVVLAVNKVLLAYRK